MRPPRTGKWTSSPSIRSSSGASAATPETGAPGAWTCAGCAVWTRRGIVGRGVLLGGARRRGVDLRVRLVGDGAVLVVIVALVARRELVLVAHPSRAGAAHDHFLGFHAISGRGEAFKSGGRVVKNVTGYDL